MNEREKHKLEMLKARFEEWMIVVNHAAKTRENYLQSVKEFMEWWKENLAVGEIREISLRHLQQYQVSLYNRETKAGKKLAISTQLGKLAGVRKFFEWLMREQEIAYNPASNLQLPINKKRVPEALSKKEIRRMIDETPEDEIGKRDRAIIEMMYGTGMRREEIIGLSIYDVDIEKATVRVKGKGGKERVIPMLENTVAAIERYLREVRPKYVEKKSSTNTTSLFISRRGRAIERVGMRQIIMRASKRAKIEKRVTPHIIRSSCATHLLKGKADIRYIQELLGHESLSTTEKYLKVEVSDLREVLRRCHPREKEK